MLKIRRLYRCLRWLWHSGLYLPWPSGTGRDRMGLSTSTSRKRGTVVRRPGRFYPDDGGARRSRSGDAGAWQWRQRGSQRGACQLAVERDRPTDPICRWHQWNPNWTDPNKIASERRVPSVSPEKLRWLVPSHVIVVACFPFIKASSNLSRNLSSR